MKFATARLALLALPLTLGLAACGKKDDAGGPAAQSAQALPTVAAPAGKAWSDVVSKTTEGGYVMGNPDAPIKLIEFGSLTCPHCAEFEEKGFPKLRDTYVNSGRVSLEFRNFVRDPFDTTMAMLTHCGTPDSFFALTQQVYANQKDISPSCSGGQGNPGDEPAAGQDVRRDGRQGRPDRFLRRARHRP
jgi:protein-disulfide isomerase